MLSPIVKIQDGKVITTSLDIAKCFIKEHKNVLRAISNIECSPDFAKLNFELSTYTDSTGRNLPLYNITRDGFVFLVTGFTGKKAAQFKEAYINAFNQMEAELNNHSGLMHNSSYRHESHLAVNAFYDACKAELDKVGIKVPNLPRPDNKVLDGLISGMLMTSRFMLSFDYKLKATISQVPMNAGVVDTKNKTDMSTIMQEFVPIELIPDLMAIGLKRLSRRIN